MDINATIAAALDLADKHKREPKKWGARLGKLSADECLAQTRAQCMDTEASDAELDRLAKLLERAPDELRQALAAARDKIAQPHIAGPLSEADVERELTLFGVAWLAGRGFTPAAVAALAVREVAAATPDVFGPPQRVRDKQAKLAEQLEDLQAKLTAYAMAHCPALVDVHGVAVLRDYGVPLAPLGTLGERLVAAAREHAEAA